MYRTLTVAIKVSVRYALEALADRERSRSQPEGGEHRQQHGHDRQDTVEGGLSNMINRFHATFSIELDPIIRAAVGDACPLAYPEPPA